VTDSFFLVMITSHCRIPNRMCLIDSICCGLATAMLRPDCRLHDHGLIPHWYTQRVGRDSSVGIMTCYGLDGLENESRWGGEIFRNCPD